MIKTDMIEMAKQLGRAIANSKQMQELKEAEARVIMDKEARELYQKYIQEKFKRQKAELLNKKIASDFKEIENLAKNNHLVGRLISCQESFNQLIKNINAVMVFAIEESPVDGCFKGCPRNCAKCMEGAWDYRDGHTNGEAIQRNQSKI